MNTQIHAAGLVNDFVKQSVDLLDQSMAKINHCVSQLSDNQVWWRPNPTINSAGNLMLHIAGNLHQWGVVPFTLAKNQRDRDSEFKRDARVSTVDLNMGLQKVVDAAKQEWEHLSANQLRKQIEIQGFEVTVMQAIIHTSSHFVGHTHQIILLTRLQLGANYRFHWTPNDERGELPI